MDAAAGVDEDVDLAADAELGQVDARLDGEARPRHHPPVLARFQVVHVGPVAVDFLADVVPGAVDEVLAVAGLLDHRPGRVVHLPAQQRLAGGEGVFTRAIAASRAAATILKIFVYFSGTASPTKPTRVRSL